MNRAMGKIENEPETSDAQDLILEALRSRKMRSNASYLAFTATPKNATLEKFGSRQPDGKFKPFHLYSMKQAIEEGFILDVLANYTTYKSYYQIEKSIEENPLFDTARRKKNSENTSSSTSRPSPRKPKSCSIISFPRFSPPKN